MRRNYGHATYLINGCEITNLTIIYLYVRSNRRGWSKFARYCGCIYRMFRSRKEESKVKLVKYTKTPRVDSSGGDSGGGGGGGALKDSQKEKDRVQFKIHIGLPMYLLQSW